MHSLVLENRGLDFHEIFSWNFLASLLSKISVVRNVSWNVLLKECFTSAKLLINASMWQIRLVVLKNSNLKDRTIPTNMQILALSAHQIWVASNQAQQLNFPLILHVFKKPTEFFRKERQRLVFEIISFVFQEKSDHSQLLAIFVHKVYNAITFFGNFLFERYSADRSLLIETLVAKMEEIVLKRISGTWLLQMCTAWQFRRIRIRSQEPNTILYSRVVTYKYKDADWKNDWRNVTGSSGEN